MVYFLFYNGTVALRRRPRKGLLSDLWEFPNELSDFDPAQWGASGREEGSIGKGKHVFSHIEWDMDSKVLMLDSPDLPEGFVFANREELESVYAVPAAFRDFMPAVLERLK